MSAGMQIKRQIVVTGTFALSREDRGVAPPEEDGCCSRVPTNFRLALPANCPSASSSRQSNPPSSCRCVHIAVFFGSALSRSTMTSRIDKTIARQREK